MSTARLLLVDNSNTRTKFALAENGKLLPQRRVLPTAEISPESIHNTLHDWQYTRAAICSVAPKAAAVLRESLGCPIQEITHTCCPELLRGYPAPHTLGADRLANAAAIAAHYPLPCIAVDLGTACTFDVVVAEDGAPRFLGGVISPGLPTLAASLCHSTALLPPTDTTNLRPETTPPIGNATQTALQAGLCYGFPGMVRGILESLYAALPPGACAVFTGGDALLPTLESKKLGIIDNDLTFKGILAITTPF